MLDRLRSQSVSRLFLLVMVLVALLPISFLGYHVYNASWQDRWREVHEKHQLIAQNLATPLETYVNDHHAMLSLLAESVLLADTINGQHAQELLVRSQDKLQGFATLVLLDVKGQVLARSDGKESGEISNLLFATEASFLMARKTGEQTLSRIKRSPVTHEPSIFMGQPVVNSKGQNIAVLLGELRIDFIEKIRAKVKFGNKGHSAIVDQRGRVIAHPNPQWMKEIKDLSDWPVVQSMMAGKTGVTSFYSSFMKENMLAGYAAVPGIGWGIMVPQPESEVAAQVNALMRSHLLWGIAGLILAIVLAIIIAKWITRPMNTLANASYELMQNSLVGNLPIMKENTPREIRQLGDVFRALISGLQDSRDEISKLNASLQSRVDEATSKLRENNKKLEEDSHKDHLTKLANRRHFEESLQQALVRRSSDIDQVCIILIDIDHFKQINDAYGHSAGDVVLSQVAGMLDRNMRSGDLVARYGGDEFVAYMRCSHDVGMERAGEIQDSIRQCAVPWEKKSIHITASIGLYCQILTSDIDVNLVLKKADNAMYEAKKRGRNRVVEMDH